jgi:predicted amidohydrolase YtcJ
VIPELGIVVVQNPTKFEVPLFVERFGARLDRLQLMRTLLAAGIPLAIGTDGPPNPFVNIRLAVTHPLNPNEALTREEAVIAYTAGSAYAEKAEKEKGRLATGMLADLAVLSQDIFTIPIDAIPMTTSLLTIVGGRIVHRTAGIL